MRAAYLASSWLVVAAAVAVAQQPAGSHDMHRNMHGMGGMMGGMESPAPGHAAGPDRRQVIELSVEERDFVLSEMRGFLDSVEAVVNGVVTGDMKATADAARRSGMGVMQHAPRTLMAKMPMEFRKLGMDTHMRFAALADEAAGMGDKQAILKQLGTLLANCGACHQGYRLVAK